jgi:hypothetical protein
MHGLEHELPLFTGTRRCESSRLEAYGFAHVNMRISVTSRGQRTLQNHREVRHGRCRREVVVRAREDLHICEHLDRTQNGLDQKDGLAILFVFGNRDTQALAYARG